MAQIESIINCCDNSGIKTGKIVHVYNTSSFKQVYTKIGSYILLSPQKKDPRKLTTIEKLHLGLIVREKKNVKRLNGHYIKFPDTSFITLRDRDCFPYTKIRGPISWQFKTHKIPEIVLVSNSYL